MSSIAAVKALTYWLCIGTERHRTSFIWPMRPDMHCTQYYRSIILWRRLRGKPCAFLGELAVIAHVARCTPALGASLHSVWEPSILVTMPPSAPLGSAARLALHVPAKLSPCAAAFDRHLARSFAGHAERSFRIGGNVAGAYRRTFTVSRNQRISKRSGTDAAVGQNDACQRPRPVRSLRDRDRCSAGSISAQDTRDCFRCVQDDRELVVRYGAGHSDPSRSTAGASTDIKLRFSWAA